MNLVVSYLSTFWSGVTWRDAIDIIVVAAVLYQILKLIRGTQAVQLLAGLAILFAMDFFAQQLHLRLLDFIFNNGSQAIVIAVVVLFQPELRRALDQMGRLGMIRPLAHHNVALQQTIIGEVCQMAFFLSEHRQGALVVFQRETGLEDIATTGVHIHAEVSAELLETIFHTGSPLHDGAVIIHSGQILAAGCVLPLAEGSTRGGRLGTRHRAALGLTTRGDAIVVIVSEETGAVSLALAGRLLRNLDQETLRSVLLSELGAQVHGPRSHVFPFGHQVAAPAVRRKTAVSGAGPDTPVAAPVATSSKPTHGQEETDA